MMAPMWIGLTALAFGVMAGSLSLLCVFALEVEGDRKSAPARDSSQEWHGESVAEESVAGSYAAAHARRRNGLLA